MFHLPLLAILTRGYADFPFKDFIKSFFLAESYTLGDLIEQPFALGQFSFGAFDTDTANLCGDRPAEHFPKIVLQGPSLRTNCFGNIIRPDRPVTICRNISQGGSNQSIVNCEEIS